MLSYSRRVLLQVGFFVLTSCTSLSQHILEDTRRVEKELILILSKAEKIEDLVSQKAELQSLFQQLAENAIAASRWSDQHGGENLPLTEKDHKLAQVLAGSLAHARAIVGADSVLREAQAEALELLDAYEQKKIRKAGSS